MKTIVPRLSYAVSPSFLYLSSFSKFLPSRALSLPFHRHQSNARRTTKRLRVKPDPTFTSSIAPEKLNDDIVFNPPSSAPSVYETPPLFLPPDDPRHQLLAQSHHHANPYNGPGGRNLPPPVRKTEEKKYHLTPKEIEEIRMLRSKDPFTWTRKALAEKFACSQFFVGMVCPANEERKEQQRQILENVKEKWGRRKRYAREDRARRRDLWARDE